MHLHGLPWLLQTYPDARIVQTHRDPLKVVASTTSLATTMRDVFQDGIVPERGGAEICERLNLWVKRAMKARERAQAPAQFIDVHYTDLVADTMAQVRRIYDAFGLGLDKRTEGAMQVHLEQNRQHKHGEHHYSLEQFGLEADELSARFSSYCERFGVSAR